MKKFIIWDNDGVLVDTEKYYFKANQLLFQLMGQTLDLETYKKISLKSGQSVLSFFRSLNFNNEQIIELRDKRDSIYEQFLSNENLALPGVDEKLQELSQHFDMGIVTSTKRMYFETIHVKTGFDKYFNFVVAREDYVNSKPDPEPYMLGILKSGFKPEEIVVIEDTPRGLNSAKAAGLDCIIVTNEFTSDADFDGAKIILNNINELTTDKIKSL